MPAFYELGGAGRAMSRKASSPTSMASIARAENHGNDAAFGTRPSSTVVDGRFAGRRSSYHRRYAYYYYPIGVVGISAMPIVVRVPAPT